MTEVAGMQQHPLLPETLEGLTIQTWRQPGDGRRVTARGRGITWVIGYKLGRKVWTVEKIHRGQIVSSVTVTNIPHYLKEICPRG